MKCTRSIRVPFRKLTSLCFAENVHRCAQKRVGVKGLGGGEHRRNCEYWQNVSARSFCTADVVCAIVFIAGTVGTPNIVWANTAILPEAFWGYVLLMLIVCGPSVHSYCRYWQHKISVLPEHSEYRAYCWVFFVVFRSAVSSRLTNGTILTSKPIRIN